MSSDPTGDPDQAKAQITDAVAGAVGNVTSPAHADAVLDAVERAVGDVREGEVADATPTPATTREAAGAVEQAAHAPRAAAPERVLVEAARQVAAAQGDEEVAIGDALQQAIAPEAASAPATDNERRMLQQALLRRLGPLKAADTAIFLWVNRLPRPAALNALMGGLSAAMNRGDAVVLGLLAATLYDRRRGRRALAEVLPTLWLTTATIEFPVKHYVRRRRPFIALVRSIVVGKKPSGYSFPSGHSAASFASAWLVARHYPRLRPPLYALAGLVGFSRIYLGVHYPGDVLTGALSGIALAALYRRVVARALAALTAELRDDE